jgi:hypothetical protein
MIELFRPVFVSAVFLIVFILLFQMLYAGLTFAPWLPTRKKDIKRALKIANLKPGDTFLELGAGTGGVLLEAASVKGVNAIGYEIFWLFVLLIKFRIIITGSDAKIYREDFFKADFYQADVIYLFGTPKGLAKKLEQKIWNECKQGTRIISYACEFVDHEPIERNKPTEQDLSFYVYEIKKPA